MRYIILKFLYSFFNLLRIKKNKVLINCFYGKQLTTEFTALIEEFAILGCYKIVIYKDQSISGVKRYWFFLINLYHLHTAEIVISNFEFSEHFTRKSCQYYFQLWHGVPLKRIGLESKNDDVRSDSLQWTHLVCTSSIEEKIFRRSFKTSPNLVFVRGHPRVFKLLELKRDVTHDVGIRSVLFAPSFDKGKTNSLLDNLIYEAQKSDIANANLKIGLRSHINIRKKLTIAANFIDETKTPLFDVIDKYDLVVTDISSIAFDFGLAGKKFVFVKSAARRYFRGINKELAFFVDKYGIDDWADPLSIGRRSLRCLDEEDEIYISDHPHISPREFVKLVKTTVDATN